MNAKAALKSYANVHYQGQVAAADPHRLIRMLYEGALERVAQAKGAMRQKQYDVKAKKVSDAINIIIALRENLDFDQGGDIAYNLDSLYDYLARCLWEGHRANDEAKLDEVAGLLAEVYSAWRQIG
ncbi:flagellar export chaperone FliS [Exilibacterium tricleocarpae]|uniref:Flagellar export chaperone FliS n=1 Tax=Exilibacterium tricleocarpae TaxID=2591008 RepID=A0A545U3V7_9GAMM|nr:flagellar export chaperone FliS [Exilibacterium tricleocarpae]TQV84155.1 flagellar export chaperone FliS [Exilibacterium tricleocarpae]